jgi:chromosome segregation ATPase
MSKPKTNAATIKILTSLQDRISDVADRERATREELAHVETTLGQKVEKADQNLRDNATGTTNALHSLKGSTQIAFDQVRNDMQTVQTALTKFNSRISGLEGQNKQDVANLVQLRSSLVRLLERVTTLESKATNVDTTTSTLETELKALLTRFGYKVSGVIIGKTTYAPITSALTGSLGTLSGSLGSQQLTGGTEAIEIKLSGSKAL